MNPNNVNNHAFFALFALLGVAIVIASIWFFFWAKNGGFVWRKTDWDDYKSTVLRRKGPDGKTLSNATPRTNLGQKSIAGTFDYDREEMKEVKREHKAPRSARHSEAHRSNASFPAPERVDADVRAYRKERAARVGGLNRDHDGSHWDHSNTDRSEITSEVSNNSRTRLHPKPAPPAAAKKKGMMEKRREKKEARKHEKESKKKQDAKKEAPAAKKQPEAPAAGGSSRPRRYSFTTVDDSTVADSAELHGSNHDSHEASYYDEYRPAYAARVSSPRRQAPRRASHHVRHPGALDAYSEAGSSDTGTKSYAHHIPGVSKSRATRDSGFRRGGPGTRRDSLSDSD